MNIEAILQELDGYFRTNQVARVEPFLLAHLAQAKAAADYSSILTLLNELMGFYRGMSRFRESLDAAQEAVSLLEQLGYKGSVPYGTTLLNVATAYRADGQIAKAIELFGEVRRIYEDNHISEGYLLASLHNNLSLAYQETGEHEKAIESLEQALPIVQKLSQSEAEVAVTYTNLASSKLRCGRIEEAKHDLLEAVRLFESQSSLNSHYGAALAALGEVAFREKRMTDAIDYYERALAQIEAHYGKNQYFAVTQESLALVLEEIDPPRSAALLAEAGQIQAALR